MTRRSFLLFAVLIFGVAMIVTFSENRDLLPVGWRFRFTPFHGTPVKREQVISINGRSLTLEIVSTPFDRAQGLSDRASMPADHGMLFQFDQSDIQDFWMNRMHFPLDIIWIDRGTVVEIAHNLPPPKDENEFPATHTPSKNADRVLELNAGGAEAYGLREGVQVPDLP